jgi:hypothetical protein
MLERAGSYTAQTGISHLILRREGKMGCVAFAWVASEAYSLGEVAGKFVNTVYGSLCRCFHITAPCKVVRDT